MIIFNVEFLILNGSKPMDKLSDLSNNSKLRIQNSEFGY